MLVIFFLSDKEK